MTWISLICLLALTSSVFGQYGYGGGYGTPSVKQIPKLLTIMRDQTLQRPILPTVPVATQGYGQQQQQQPVTTDWSLPVVQQQQQDTSIQENLQTPYGSTFSPILSQKILPVQNFGLVSQGMGMGSMQFIPQLDQQQVQQVQQVPILTEADTICRGQRAETIIPLENGRKFVVCLDDGKGVEQQCPKGLYYHTQSQRCERNLGPLENPCVTQPCLNGGQCVQTDSSYQCQCATGFDGKTCELDVRVCQTQQPCGQSTDTRCQSFRLGAALQYICIFQDGVAYGLSPSQVQQSPCQGVDGPQALAVTNKGFIMCDGERMFVESCPGGTVWDDVNKACVWPDMQTPPQLDQQRILGQLSYGQQREMIPKTAYGNQWAISQIQQPKMFQSLGTKMIVPQQLEQPKTNPSYTTQITVPQLFEQSKQTQSYGGQITVPQLLEQPKQIQSYGGQITLPQLVQQPKVMRSWVVQPQDNLVSVKQSSGY